MDSVGTETCEACDVIQATIRTVYRSVAKATAAIYPEFNGPPLPVISSSPVYNWAAFLPLSLSLSLSFLLPARYPFPHLK